MKRRWIEFAFFFWILPVLVAMAPARVLPPIPILWGCALVALFVLRRSPDFDRRLLWNPAGILPACRGCSPDSRSSGR